MSIDWLLDLERAIDNGKEVFACPGPSRDQWVIGRSADELRKVAKRAADTKKVAVNIVRVISRNEAIAGDLYLVPTNIGEAGPRGEPAIQWRAVETKDAAETFKDVRHGPAPFFGIQVLETVNPEGV
jgi:hypothetical protein